MTAGAGAGDIYAGIGARATPGEVLERMEHIAARLARLGLTLRTGMSPGADQAFYRGALGAGGRVELYLPHPGFQSDARLPDEHGRVLASSSPTPAAFALAERAYTPAAGRPWSALVGCERALLARDAQQVLGEDLGSPAAFVVCWTPGGGRDGRDPRSGGTGQALRVASAHSLPVFNIANPADLEAMRRRVA